MTRQVSVARYRRVLVAVAITIVIGAALGVLSVVDEPCHSALRGLRAAILGFFVVFPVAALLGIGGLLAVAVGWWRRETPTIRSGVAMLLVGFALVGSFILAGPLANPCGR